MEKIVNNDGKGLFELLNLDEGTLEHQGNFCFMASRIGERVDIYTEPVDEFDEDYKEIKVYEVNIEDERYEFCEWCDELCPMSELRTEKELGYLCDNCKKGIESKGEHLNIE